MAKSINNATASLISDMERGEAFPNNILATEAVGLSIRGFIDLSCDGDLILTDKARRALKRFKKEKKISKATDQVRNVINEMLTEPGAVTQHRAVWERVGRDKYERDTVLQALNNLKKEGFLENHRTSGNNFQVYWRLASDNVPTPTFETI